MPISKTDMIIGLLRLPSDDDESHSDNELLQLVSLIRKLGFRSPLNCIVAAIELFQEIERRHGKKAARRIFADAANPSKRTLNDRKNYAMLMRVAGMRMSGRSIGEAAIELTGGGTARTASMERKLRRLIEQWNRKPSKKSSKKAAGHFH